ncbi:HD domain-containing phosphohydrolase [Deinococcus hopiensis]|uniref:PAS domain S-box-containing protein n=1 Tax=Deinococcus hopiensis KR-140 TaxID=695939 RepID=A0A1W1UVM3_9DEIO|nr:HD domain-containing phosphohydrolase [Deinococcus hopiensis]SMB85218.1 PAS domain S-box-containing protein [Deinococcus hopiensis KR-140]
MGSDDSMTSADLSTIQRAITRHLTVYPASHDVIQQVLEWAGQALGAHSASICTYNPRTQSLHRVNAMGYSEERLREFRDIPVEPGLPITDAVLEQRTICLTARDWDERYPHLTFIRLPEMQAIVALPLLLEGKVHGTLTFSWDSGRTLDGFEWVFLEGFALQCADALYRLRRTAWDHKVLEYSGGIVLVFGADRKVSFLSSSVTALLGYTEEDLRNLHLPDVLHPEEAHLVRDVLADPGRSLRTRIRVRHKAGGWIWLDVTVQNLLADPDVQGFVVNAHDVSSSVRAIEALRVSDRAHRQAADRYRHLLDLVNAFDLTVDPDALILTMLERAMAVTGFPQAFYYAAAGTDMTLRWARGAHTDEALALLPNINDLRAFGKPGLATMRGELFFAAADEALFDPPEALPRHFWRSFCSVPILMGGALHGVFVFVSGAEDRISPDLQQLMQSFADHVNVMLERYQHVQQLDTAREETFRALGRALEYRDHDTHGHTARVVQLAERLGRALELNEAQQDALRWGAYLHDVGKIGVSDQVLLKPGALTEGEWWEMRTHPQLGYAILAQIPTLPAETLGVVRHHHERWDGRGYPDGLAGDEVPLLARVFAVVDVYDALTSKRPYKAAWTREEAMTELERMAGSHLDPDIVHRFLTLLSSDVIRSASGDDRWHTE